MQFIQNQKLSIARAVVITFVLGFISISLISQESKYLGTEPDINHEQLIQMASTMDFGDQIFKTIYKDDKNTYFALLTEKISSRYEAIKLLELISSKSDLVNIGASPTSKYSIFLINNSLGKSDREIEQLMNDYIVQVHDRAIQLTEEQQQQWLQQNDKYSGKN
ncbi:MAG: hypothetical protein Q8O72_11885 [Bacteroidales bacterium]|nr:hypothetical protein [Bacteroidales bacterium]